MSLIAWYKFNESGGTLVHDNKGGNYNGILSGDATFVSGKIGNAINFTGTSGQNRAIRGSDKVGRPEPYPISRIKKAVRPI